ncbi:hypothetical protein BVC80_701g4 [Macleaya cordata]|uniref:Ovarian tumor n=1 Tax=Macleaya cordata TaxID=56857 RepID=A0A200R8L4_MACCD|nr:hypothetical protein BVC80_701g4 [Macleaya cordata]
MLDKLKEIASPRTTGMQEPSKKAVPRGRLGTKQTRAQQKKENSTKRDPSQFELFEESQSKQTKSNSTKLRKPPRKSPNQSKKQYGTYTENVKADGNCGFRVIAHQLGDDNDEGWRTIRWEMLCELQTNLEFYQKLWPEDEIQKMFTRYKCETDIITTNEWFVTPMDEQVAAQAFSSVVVSISRHDNVTFFPHQTHSPAACYHRVIVMAFVNGNHFIGLNLKPDAPIPPAYYLWVKHSPADAKNWLSPYDDKIKEWKRILNIKEVDQNDFITI